MSKRRVSEREMKERKREGGRLEYVKIKPNREKERDCVCVCGRE